MRVSEPYTLFLRKLPSGKEVYYYQFRDEYGRRSPAYSTGCEKLSQARRYCNTLYNEGKLVKTSAVLFGVFAGDFFDDGSPWLKWKEVSKDGITPSTLHSYRKILRNQIMPFFADIPLNKITTFCVKDWIVWMSGKWSPKTTNNAQSVLNIILKSARERNLIQSVPSRDLTFRETQKKHRELLTREEVRMIYRSPLWTTEARRKFFLLDAITGMRVGECASLEKSDIFENYVSVTTSADDRFGVGQTKTKMSRYVPIPAGFFDGYPLDEGWVFPRRSGAKPIYYHGIYKNFVHICESLGINRLERGITMHTLRNFFISYLEEKNVPEPKIRAVVGHTEDTMTNLYTYWKPEMFPEVYKAQEELYRYMMEEEK